MARTFWIAGVVIVQLVAAQLAFCRPPDEVVNSPVPPLKEPAKRVPPRERTRELTDRRDLLLVSPPRVSPTKPPAEIPTGKENAQDTQYYLTEQSLIWNSPEMKEARKFVVEFSRRSAHTTLEEGQRFLDQLAKLPPGQMQSWLKRYRESRLKIALEREVEQFARQLMVERAINRQEAMRQAFAHVSQLRAEAVAAMQMQRQDLATRRLGCVEDSWILDLRPIYDPIDATTDPMNPRGYVRRVAGAMTLPGDLPRDDPRNFIEGEEGVDFGEWATSPDAEPPAE